MANSVQGIDNLLKKLSLLGGNTEQALNKGITKATMHVQGDAKELCTVDKGGLRNSIKATTKNTNKGIVGEVSTNVEHAPYVEFGTGQRGDSADIEAKKEIDLSYKDDWVGMKPQPFLYPALKQNEGNVSQILANEIKSEIRKLGG